MTVPRSVLIQASSANSAAKAHASELFQLYKLIYFATDLLDAHIQGPSLTPC